MRMYLADIAGFLAIDDTDAVVACLPELLGEAGIEVKGLGETDGRRWVTLEFLANRGDHHSYFGVATELAPRLTAAVNLPKLADVQVAEASAAEVTTERCFSYTLTPMSIIDRSATLQAEVIRRITLAGLAAGGAVVDATNAALVEFGQPTHAFDADAVVGMVRVRDAAPQEPAWLLGEPGPRALPADAVVIADDEKILAVAGVIGCEGSRVTPATRRILVESALFDPVAVRKASRALAVPTMAAARLERGGDPDQVLPGVARVVALLEDAGAALRDGPTQVAREWAGQPPVIDCPPEAVNRLLGTDLAYAEIRDRLVALGCHEVGASRFQVPGARIWDLREPEDLIEEIARSVGYDELPTVVPVATSVPSRRRQSSCGRSPPTRWRPGASMRFTPMRSTGGAHGNGWGPARTIRSMPTWKSPVPVTAGTHC